MTTAGHASVGPQRIVCMIAPDNAPSLALAERLGFSRIGEGELREGEAIVLLERQP